MTHLPDDVRVRQTEQNTLRHVQRTNTYVQVGIHTNVCAYIQTPPHPPQPGFRGPNESRFSIPRNLLSSIGPITSLARRALKPVRQAMAFPALSRKNLGYEVGLPEKTDGWEETVAILHTALLSLPSASSLPSCSLNPSPPSHFFGNPPRFIISETTPFLFAFSGAVSHFSFYFPSF